MLHTSPRFRRSGVILLVVVSMLTLFAIVGLSFVMYAESEAKGAALSRDAQVQFRPDLDAEMLASFALGQFIYDVHDDETGVYSAMRGHSLGRSMYGYNYSPGGANVVPFNGVGRLRSGVGTPQMPQIPPQPGDRYNNPFGISDHFLPNCTFFPSELYKFGGRDFAMIRDPERIDPPPPSPGMPPWRTSVGEAPGNFTGGYNVPYTFPDLNNMFLAAVNANGAVLLPSFHRPWTGFNSQPNTGLEPGSQRWLNDAQGRWSRYAVLRPRPADHAGFPPPEDGGGDVKQLVGSPGTLIPGSNPPQYWNNDSFWMDLGFPVRIAPDGTKYKPLFAFLVTDLDNRINLTVHGNVRGLIKDPNQIQAPPIRGEHRSNQGWGPWEVNIGKVLTSPDPTQNLRREWTNLFLGDSNFGRTWSGRYGLGANAQPSTNSVAPAGQTPHFYGQADFDASKLQAAIYGISDRFGVPEPGLPLPLRLQPFPVYPAGSGWDNGTDSSPTVSERRNHPLLYDVMQSGTSTVPTDPDRRFGLSNMEALLRYTDTGSPALTSELFQLCPENFRTNSRARNLVTVRSFDLDRPGASPWLYTAPNGAQPQYQNQYPLALPLSPNADPYRAPHGSPFAFPQLGWRDLPPPGFNRGEFSATDWRWQPVIASALYRVDLNRKLSSYPAIGVGPLEPTYSKRMDEPANEASYLRAHADRQLFANDLYTRLLSVMGLRRQAPVAQSQLPLRRWLAQIAVNIVDYIDEDDISTAFHFYTLEDSGNDPAYGGVGQTLEPPPSELLNYWVFGTELPRVVINEALFESHPNLYDSTTPAGTYDVRAYVELHNPFPNAPLPTTVVPQDGQGVRLRMLRTVTATASQPTGQMTAYNIFQVQITTGLRGTNSPTPLPSNENVLGTPEEAPRKETSGATGPDFDQNVYLGATTTPAIIPLNGFMALTPDSVPPSGTGGAGSDGRGTIPPQLATIPWMRSPNLTYTYTLPFAGTVDELRTGLTVTLRRLANPHLPPEPIPVLNGQPNPWYNPYITIDHVDENPIRHYQANPPSYASRGKQQPFASFAKAEDRQAVGGPYTVRAALPHSPFNDHQVQPPPSTYHSFGSANHDSPPSQLLPVRDHYDWLTHLDRQLVSPMELLHVSGFPPHDLTQRFVTTFNTRGVVLAPGGTNPVVPMPPMTGDSDGGLWKIENGTRVLVTDQNMPPWSVQTAVVQIDPAGLRLVGANYPQGRPLQILGQQPFNQRLPWFDETSNISMPAGNSHRLHRFLEFVHCGSRASGVVAGGRIPGKININTIWDQETFRALCDARVLQQPGDPNPNHFDERHVDAMFNMLTVSRTGGPGITFGPNNRPLQSLAVGVSPPIPGTQHPTGLGLSDTIQRYPVAGATERLLQLKAGADPNYVTPVPDVDRPHPYLQEQLLNKIFNHLTTRSNVFAVYLTVGFFEVKDDSVRPVKLGAEIGKAENRHVRHRMFAIVDRTNLSVATGVGYTDQVVPPPPPTPPTPQLVKVFRNLNFDTSVWSNIRAGATVLVDVGERQEAVVVTRVIPVGPDSIQMEAVFTKPHDGLYSISLPNMTGDAPFFLKATSIEPVNNPNLPNQYWVTIPVSGQNAQEQLFGEYDGVQWKIGPRWPPPPSTTINTPPTYLIIGSGADQEFVVVEDRHLPTNLSSTELTLQPGIPTNFGRFRVTLRRPHPEPCAVSNTLLGNPGPQPRFNPRQQPYSAVVRYLSIIQ